jgi:hypothetical protein
MLVLLGWLSTPLSAPLVSAGEKAHLPALPALGIVFAAFQVCLFGAAFWRLRQELQKAQRKAVQRN